MTRPGPAARGSGPADGSEQPRTDGGQNEAWSVFSYLISGMAAYGGIGWIAGRFGLRNVMLAWTACFVVSLVVGMAGGMSAFSSMRPH